MDTLISVGTLAAWGWSVVALFFLDAGDPSMRMPFELFIGRGREREPDLPRGRVRRDGLHPRRDATSRPEPSGSAGAALKALLELGAKEANVLDDRRSRAARRRRAASGRRQVRRSSRREAADGRRRRGRPLRDRQVAADRGERAGRGRARRRGDRRHRSTSADASSSAPPRSARTRRSAQIARLVTGGAVRKGVRSAPRRPGLRSLRPDRDRDRGCDARLLARRRGGRRVRVLSGGRRSDHCLPVCARTGDADRSPRRHGPRRPARHPDQRTGGARVDSPGRHRSCSTRREPSRRGRWHSQT